MLHSMVDIIKLKDLSSKEKKDKKQNGKETGQKS